MMLYLNKKIMQRLTINRVSMHVKYSQQITQFSSNPGLQDDTTTDLLGTRESRSSTYVLVLLLLLICFMFVGVHMLGTLLV